MTACTAVVEAEFTTEGNAELILAGLRTDDDDFVSTATNGASVMITATGPTVASMRRALDDALASLLVAEDVLRVI